MNPFKFLRNVLSATRAMSAVQEAEKTARGYREFKRVNGKTLPASVVLPAFEAATAYYNAGLLATNVSEKHRLWQLSLELAEEGLAFAVGHERMFSRLRPNPIEVVEAKVRELRNELR